jgi:hypothetical protein
MAQDLSTFSYTTSILSVVENAYITLLLPVETAGKLP